MVLALAQPLVAQSGRIKLLPGDTIEPLRRVDVAALRLPSSGYAIIREGSVWRELWRRYGRSPGRPRSPVPDVDFTKDAVVIVGFRGWVCSPGTAIRRASVLHDTLQVVALAGQCGNSSAEADAILFDRTRRHVSCTRYGTPIPPADWFANRTLADLDTIAEPASRAGWLEVLSRADTSAENSRRLALASVRFGGGDLLLAQPWVQRDSQAVYTLMYYGAKWTEEATRLMIEYRGEQIVKDPATLGETLLLIYRYAQRYGEGRDLVPAIYRHPAIAKDAQLRAEMERSGILTRRP